MEMKVSFRLTGEYREQYFVEHGEVLPCEQELTVNAAELSEKARRAIALDHGTTQKFSVGSYEQPLTKERLNADLEERWDLYEAAVSELQRAADEQLAELEGIENLADKFCHWKLPGVRVDNSVERHLPGGMWKDIHSHLTPEQKDRRKALEKRFAEEEKIKKADLARRNEEAEAKKEALKEQYEAEKLQWIEEHGSDYLKKAVSNGFDSQRKYVEERAAIEFAGFLVDFDGSAEWNDRSFPSEEALDILEQVKPMSKRATIVWIISRHDADPEWSDEQEEAVVIRGFLGGELRSGYDLIKYLGDPKK